MHITGPGQAKINLIGAAGNPELVYSIGIKHGDLRRLMDEVNTKRTDFLAEWERIHG